jgi:hypothetical protein
VATEPEEGRQYLVGKRQIPFGFGWVKKGLSPYDELPLRINRIAYKECTRNPDLSEAGLREVLGRDLFDDPGALEAVDDALFLQSLFVRERTWSQSAPLVSPDRVHDMASSGALTSAKKQEYRLALERVRRVDERWRSAGPRFAVLSRIAQWIHSNWTREAGKLLE